MAAPVKNTCPDIDAAIKKVVAALKIAHDGMRMHEKRSDDWYNYDSIETELMNLEGELEDLRKDNEALRDWGNELDEEVEKSANYINSLEEKVEKLEQALKEHPANV